MMLRQVVENGELFPVYAGIHKIRQPSDPKK
jgi:hypothetical protein